MTWITRIALWFGGALAVLVVIPVLAVGVLLLTAWTAHPVYEGAVSTPGLTGEARIVRDANAVPHISGETERDVLFALGFAHAQDRFWQMELARRAAQGRISELLGSAALPSDRYMRTFQFERLAREAYAAFEPADQARLQAYAEGVNAWLASRVYRKPAEYVLTLTKPEPWRPVDSLLVTKMLWVGLSTNFSEELTRARLARSAGTDVARDYFPPYPADGHVAMAWPDLARTLGLPLDQPRLDPSAEPDASAAALDSPEAAPVIASDPLRENSNNWVVSGARSTSGAPLLANDPHLGLTMPGFWYLARLELPTGPVVGATIPGAPAVVLGHNAHLAWGATNAHDSDVMDVYLEPRIADDPEYYATPDGPAPFEVREETFAPRFAAKQTFTYRTTRHGPVLPREIFGSPITDHDRYAVSLAWTALQDVDRTLSAIMAMNRAQSVGDMRAAMQDFHGPPQNMVFAHREGDIGLAVVGRVPIRAVDHETRGASPARGDAARNDWQGLIPTEFTPLVINPSSGALVTANAQVVPDAYPYFRSVERVAPSRQQRIQDLINARAQHDAESFIAIQMDLTPNATLQLLPRLLAVEPRDEATADAHALLSAWDGAWEGDRAEPLIYAAWLDQLTTRIIADDLGALGGRYRMVSQARLLHILTGPLSAWCDDRATEAQEDCDAMIAESLEAAIALLSDAHGPMEDWRWDAVFANRHAHLGFGDVPVLGDVFSRATPRAAAPGAPNDGMMRAGTLPESAGLGHGANLRMIVDMADPNSALFAVSSGQSGHVASRHYDDLQEVWRAGGYITIPATAAEITNPRTLVLRPEER